MWDNGIGSGVSLLFPFYPLPGVNRLLIGKKASGKGFAICYYLNGVRRCRCRRHHHRSSFGGIVAIVFVPIPPHWLQEQEYVTLNGREGGMTSCQDAEGGSGLLHLFSGNRLL